MKLTANFKEAEDVIAGIGEQLPFAIARTLTKVAQEGQAAGIAEEKSVFKLRNDWTTQNTKIKPATKQSLTAEVYTDTSNRITGAPDYLVRQEDSGERVPVDGRMHIAIPTKYLRAMVGNKPIPDYLRPRAMLGYAELNGGYINRRDRAVRGKSLGREYYFFKVKFKSGTLGIMARAVADAREAALPMYILVAHANIPKRLNLQEDVQKAIDANLQLRWDETLQTIGPLEI